MPYCDECLDGFPFDDDDSCLCPPCRERRAELLAYENDDEGGAMEEG